MNKWVDAMACHGGGGGPKVTYGPVFFHWLRSQLLMVENYAYAGEYLKDDPDLPLLEGYQQDDRGKKHITIHVFCFLFHISFFYQYDVMLRHTKMFCTDIGPSRLT